MVNQKMIQIDNDNFLTRYGDIMEASRVLSGAAFKLYIYFLQEENNTEISFRPAWIKELLGLSINSIHSGFGQLFEKGYLEKKSDNIFIFHAIKN